MMRADGRTRAASPWGQVHGCMYAIRTRNDDVVVIQLHNGRMKPMLYTPKMVAHAEMGLFPGGSAQSSKTGRESIGSATPSIVRPGTSVSPTKANVMMRADGRTRAAPPWGQVHGCMYAIRARNDDVVIIPLHTGRMRTMLYTLKMVAHAEMGLFPGGSAQRLKTGWVSGWSAIP